jgi:hypothetical protein
MMKFKPCFPAALMVLVLGGAVDTSSAQQRRRGEQDGVRVEMQKGTIHSLRQIESNVVPAMKRRGADYIGAEFDGALLRYRLKFVRQSSVIWIDVDGKSGAIIAQAGN